MPRGPLPAHIYWRRRLLVLAIALGIILIAVTLWPDGSDPQAEPTAEPTATPSPVRPEPGDDGIAIVSLSASEAACDPSQVRIVPSVASGQRSGSNVDISLAVSTTSEQSCTVDVTQDNTLMVIRSGAVVWESAACSAPIVTGPISVSTGWSTIVTSPWSGRRSGAGCDAREPFVGAGTYEVEVGLIGGEPGRAEFELGRAAPTPAPTPTPTPTATPTGSPSVTAAPQTPASAASTSTPSG